MIFLMGELYPHYLQEVGLYGAMPQRAIAAVLAHPPTRAGAPRRRPTVAGVTAAWSPPSREQAVRAP